MFDKKIILLLSFLLISCSSYIIIHHKKNNDDEVNIVDNSDNISKEAVFTEILILFIIVIIIVIIIFFVIKRLSLRRTIPKKIKKIIEYQLPELKEDKKKYSKEFNEYIRNRNKILKKNKIDKNNIKKLTEEIINRIKKEYDEYIKKNNINPEGYSKDNYLVDFYFGIENRDEKNNIKISEDNQNIFIKDGKRVRDINAFQTEEIAQRLLALLFNELLKDKRFLAKKFDRNDVEEVKKLVNIFIATVVEPFLHYVSENKKNIKFISCFKTISNITTEYFNYYVTIKSSCDMLYFLGAFHHISDNWPKDLMLNELINLYFPESQELNKTI